MGVLSIFGLVFAPFGKVWTGGANALFGIFVGLVFMVALYVLYEVLWRNEASRVGPAIGGLTPIFVSLLAIFFLGEKFGNLKAVAFILLVAGGLLISYQKGREGIKSKKNGNLETILMIFVSAFLFGVYYILLKSVFNGQNFVSGFVWTRIGSFLGGLLILLSAKNRKAIFGNAKTIKASSGGLLIANKTLSGVAFALLNYAISLGSVSIINAMQGLQYVFLLGIVVFLSKKYPSLLKENIDKKSIFQKSFAIFLIFIGLFIIAYKHRLGGI